MAKVLVANIRHPAYQDRSREWAKYRLVAEGGQRCINTYLQRFGRRESAARFNERKLISFNPAFAMQAVEEVRNSLFARLEDVCREGGSVSYQAAVRGEDGGVDLQGSSMNA